MTADEAYSWLIRGTAPEADPFDAHVLASILALAIAEGGVAGRLCAHSGLDAQTLRALSDMVFPGCGAGIERMTRHSPPPAEIEETSVRDLLRAHAIGASPLDHPLAAMIARRAMEPDHLWQDLAMRDRGELTALLDRHFAPLARQNTASMTWKRFFFRTLCEEECFVLCSAPVCTDFETCFGKETGEARPARLRNGISAPRPA